MPLLTNPTATPQRYCFTREDNVAYVTTALPAGTFPSDTGDHESDWFDLLPGHQCQRRGAFGGVNWEPVQSPIEG